MPRDNIKDYLDGNELDLSLNNLSLVPVKELQGIPKATHLDLSCNILTSLPDSFCSLTHLVKIDLSKNSLTALPKKFGNLTSLQHLDLLGNQLNTLPHSFCNLQRLKWLDLKDNPLETNLGKAAGDCLDENQCRKCAKNVLAHVQREHDEAERNRQKALLAKQEREEKERQKEEALRLKKLEKKAAERERKKQAKLEQKKMKSEDIEEEEDGEATFSNDQSEGTQDYQKKSCLGSFCSLLFSLLTLCLLFFLSAYFFCEWDPSQQFCVSVYEPAKHHTRVNYNIARISIGTLLKTHFGNNTVSEFLLKKS